MNEEEIDKLVEEFKSIAKRSFRRTGAEFWDHFVNALVRGEAPSLDMSRAKRKPLQDGEMRMGLHKILGIQEPLEKATPELLVLYDALIKFIRSSV